MKEFLAIYTGAPPAFAEWQKMDAATRSEREAKGMKAWGDWMEKHGASIAVQGGPLGKTKRITASGITDIRNNIAGFIVVRAESHEAAAKLFLNHPHFTIFPGDGVEIMEQLPIPRQ